MFSSNTSQVSGGYEIQRSLRFNGPDSAYLNRTFSSTGNRKTWTWSGWIKRSTLSVLQALFGSQQGVAGVPRAGIQIEDTNAITFIYNSTGSANSQITTTAVYRDASAWYHVVLAVDTTQATSSNRLKLYINGVQVTSFTTADYPTLNEDLPININTAHMIGSFDPGAGTDRFFRGYMTEVHFIDGQALTPSSFGAFDAQTGVWGPTPYAGSYGTNGFYLNFSDNSNTTAATLGKDYSGNGNNWTPNNFSVSAGAGNDSLVDVPTNWGTDTGVGGSVRGNYCTWNPLDFGSSVVVANGNLDASISSANWRTGRATFGITSGKWYWEISITGGTASPVDSIVGIARQGADLLSYLGSDENGWGYYGANGNRINNITQTAYGATFTTNDIVGVAFDADAGALVFFKNGASQGTAFTGLTSGPYLPAVGLNAANTVANFGQRPFAYTAPSGFKALNTQNLPTPTIGATTATQANLYFNPVLYTGDRTDRTITVGFQPDLVWVKPRNNADGHYWMNAVVGTGKYLMSDSTASEVTNANTLTAYTSTGFSVGNTGTTNETGRTYVAWNWKANGAGVTNTAGSITSTVSANTTSGFSVATFTTPSSGAFTFGHGLGAAPAMVIAKARATAGLAWVVYHRAIGPTQYLALNGSGAAVTLSSVWNDTAPTSTVVSSTAAGLGASQTYVAYCFAEVPGYSKFGSYTGNGSTDGPFVFCGFRPAWVLVKRSNGADDWHLFDNRRDGFNVTNDPLYPNGTYAEGSGYNYLDLVSNGFKCRNNSYINNSGVPYIFMALAEAPQKFALAR